MKHTLSSFVVAALAASFFPVFGCAAPPESPDAPPQKARQAYETGYCFAKGSEAWASTSTFCSLRIGYDHDVDPNIPQAAQEGFDINDPPGWGSCMEVNTNQICSIRDDIRQQISRVNPVSGTTRYPTAVGYLASVLPGAAVGPAGQMLYSVLANLVTSFLTHTYDDTLLVSYAIQQNQGLYGGGWDQRAFGAALLAASARAEAIAEQDANEKLIQAELAQQAATDADHLLREDGDAIGFYLSRMYQWSLTFFQRNTPRPGVSSGQCFGPPVNACTRQVYGMQNGVRLFGDPGFEVVHERTCYLLDDGRELCPWGPLSEAAAPSSCPAPEPHYRDIGGRCVPSCGAAGGNVCDAAACEGQPLLEAYDCGACCTL